MKSNYDWLLTLSTFFVMLCLIDLSIKEVVGRTRGHIYMIKYTYRNNIERLIADDNYQGRVQQVQALPYSTSSEYFLIMTKQFDKIPWLTIYKPPDIRYRINS